MDSGRNQPLMGNNYPSISLFYSALENNQGWTPPPPPPQNQGWSNNPNPGYNPNYNPNPNTYPPPPNAGPKFLIPQVSITICLHQIMAVWEEWISQWCLDNNLWCQDNSQCLISIKVSFQLILDKIIIIREHSSMPCRMCGFDGMSTWRQTAGCATYSWCVCLLCFFWPLFWLPFCMDSCYDTEVVCSRCGQVKGRIQADCCWEM